MMTHSGLPKNITLRLKVNIYDPKSKKSRRN